MKNNKVWGLTELLFCNENFEVHRIETKAGGYSSEHKHDHKFNMFFVERGKINIHVWKNDYDLCDVTELKAREGTGVFPGEWHKFESIEDSVVYEIYYPQPIGKDIERRNVGGLKK